MILMSVIFNKIFIVLTTNNKIHDMEDSYGEIRYQSNKVIYIKYRD